MAYLDRDGVPVYYQVSGAQNGNLPVLLSHGFAASSQMWEPNVEALAAARPVVSWDLDEARQRWNDYAIGQAGRLERDGLAAFGESPETRDAGHRSAAGLARAARGILTQRDGSVIGSLPSITIPALVLVGARDQRFLAAAEYMAAKIPGAVHAVIPDAGHACNIDQPELFNRQVLAFLQRRDLR
jgi:pimeloyl-ACP methyl ester carboxylesterase